MPLTDLIQTKAASKIRRADGSFINTTKVAITAAKAYLNYLDLVEPSAISYQMACATTIKLDNVLYVQQNVVMNGRRIYRDESEIDGNYLMYDYADYTWRITPDYHSEEATLFNTSTVTYLQSSLKIFYTYYICYKLTYLVYFSPQVLVP